MFVRSDKHYSRRCGVFIAVNCFARDTADGCAILLNESHSCILLETHLFARLSVQSFYTYADLCDIDSEITAFFLI